MHSVLKIYGRFVFKCAGIMKTSNSLAIKNKTWEKAIYEKYYF